MNMETKTLKKYHTHNNGESQKNFDDNQVHFNRQCRIVLEQLLKGRLEELRTQYSLA